MEPSNNTPTEPLQVSFWPEVKEYLENPQPGRRVIAQCVICYANWLDIRGLSAPGDMETEKAILFPCGHLVGKTCWEAYKGSLHNQIPPCPVCRTDRRILGCRKQRCVIAPYDLPGCLTLGVDDGWIRQVPPIHSETPNLRHSCRDCKVEATEKLDWCLLELQDSTTTSWCQNYLEKLMFIYWDTRRIYDIPCHTSTTLHSQHPKFIEMVKMAGYYTISSLNSQLHNNPQWERDSGLFYPEEDIQQDIGVI